MGGRGAFENRRPSYAYVTFCIVLHMNSPNLGETGAGRGKVYKRRDMGGVCVLYI